MKRLFFMLLAGLLLTGCIGGILGTPKYEWNVKKYDYDGVDYIGVTGVVTNVSRSAHGVGSIVAYALSGETVLDKKYIPCSAWLEPYKELRFTFLFKKEDVPGITHIKLAISSSNKEPYDNLTDHIVLFDLR